MVNGELWLSILKMTSTSSGFQAGEWKLMFSQIMMLKPNRISTVKECDARMLSKVDWLDTKIIIDN
jgi:hypothetical protein